MDTRIAVSYTHLDVYKRQAAYGVVQRLVLIGCYVVMGFMQGYQPVASYSFGANKEERFHESVRFALRTSLILTVLVAGICILLARPLIMLFNRNPAVIDYGARLLISQVALYPAFGPVSYTHLDVYKRQVLRQAFG